jgi:hypothetical protein
MTGIRKVGAGLLAAGVLCLLPVGAFAGPLSHPPAEPGLAPYPYYSPCHYWTPLLYRCWAKCHYGVCGHQYTLDYYPSGPTCEPTPSPPSTPVEPGTTPGKDKPVPPARSPDGSDRK